MHKMKYISTDVSTKTANVAVTSTFSVPTNQTAELRNDKKPMANFTWVFLWAKKTPKKLVAENFGGFLENGGFTQQTYWFSY